MVMRRWDAVVYWAAVLASRSTACLVLQYGTIRYSDVSLLKYSFEFFAPFSRFLRNHTCIYAARPPRDLLTALPLPRLLRIRE